MPERAYESLLLSHWRRPMPEQVLLEKQESREREGEGERERARAESGFNARRHWAAPRTLLSWPMFPNTAFSLSLSRARAKFRPVPVPGSHNRWIRLPQPLLQDAHQ